MAVTADSVVIELLAKTDGYTANINGAASATTTAMSKIERSASQAENQIVRSTGAIANAQRNLGRQVADIGTQLASGQSPFLILAQQAPQVADALADTGGRAARVATFFAGPWGAALLAAGSIAGVLAEKLFGASAAQDELKRSAEAAAEAERLLQGVLGGTIDQTEKARVASLERAQALTFEARAALNNARAQLTLAKSYQAAAQAGSRAGAPAYASQGLRTASADANFRDRQVDVSIAESALAAAEIRLKNLERVAQTARGIEAKKDTDAQARKDAAAARKEAAEARRAAAEARKANREAERQAREQAQFTAQRLRGQADLASAEADLTADTRLQDEALRVRIRAERDATIAGIQADPDRTAAQKSELIEIESRVAAARLRLVNINETQRFLDETLSLQRADLSNQADILNEQGALAQTDAERRAVALRLLDLAFERERLELEAVLASKKATDVEKQIAQRRLDQLGTLFGVRRDNVDRQYEGAGARFRRQLSADSDQLGELVDRAAIDGMIELNNQLTDAVLNSRSLGEAFHNVSRQIVADLLRIAIQQTIIKPLADSLFGGTGGVAAKATGFLGSIFGRASGGYMAPGSIARVNEGRSTGVELLRMGSQGGTVIPLGQAAAPARGGNTTVHQHFALDMRGAMTFPEFVAGLSTYVNQTGQQAAAAGTKGALAAMPGVMNQRSSLKG